MRVTTRLIATLIRSFVVRCRLVGTRNLRCGGARRILVANHAGSFGPLSVVTALPLRLVPWVVHDTLDPKLNADRIRREFLESELHLHPPFSRWLARAISRIASALLSDYDAIPVYLPSRQLQTTVSKSLELMERGKTIVVFPEDSTRPLNGIISEFSTGFIHLAKLFYERTRQAVQFLPVAVNNKLRRIRVGEPIAFEPDVPFAAEKARLKRELQETITCLCQEQGPVERSA